jgi:hypothetical protein
MILKHYADLCLKHLTKETLPIPRVKVPVGAVKCVSRFITQKDKKGISLHPKFDRTDALTETTRKNHGVYQRLNKNSCNFQTRHLRYVDGITSVDKCSQTQPLIFVVGFQPT